MFDVRAVVLEVEAEENLKSEGTPRAKVAKRANNEAKVSTLSTLSTPPPSENENIQKLQAFNCLYSADKNSTAKQDSVPFTDQELAEHAINKLKLHDDRVFVQQKLIGIYGAKRLDMVFQYLDEWQNGMEAEPAEVKKENAGRYRANIWLRTQSKAGKNRG